MNSFNLIIFITWILINLGALILNFGLDSIAYKLYQRRLWNQIKDGIRPKHVALIMDGNRRYARSKNLPSHLGHQMGRKKLTEVLEWFWDLSIDYVTIYAFSTENFNREDKEVSELMKLFEATFHELVDHPELKSRNVKIKAIGRIHLLPEGVQKAIRACFFDQNPFALQSGRVVVKARKVSVYYFNDAAAVDTSCSVQSAGYGDARVENSRGKIKRHARKNTLGCGQAKSWSNHTLIAP